MKVNGLGSPSTQSIGQRGLLEEENGHRLDFMASHDRWEGIGIFCLLMPGKVQRYKGVNVAGFIFPALTCKPSLLWAQTPPLDETSWLSGCRLCYCVHRRRQRMIVKKVEVGRVHPGAIFLSLWQIWRNWGANRCGWKLTVWPWRSHLACTKAFKMKMTLYLGGVWWGFHERSPAHH